MNNYRNLRAWSKAISLVEVVYRATRAFPKHEQFGLTAQIRRSAVSIPSNIAEGQARLTRGEWLQFLGHARGSLYELETQIEIAERLRFWSDADRQMVETAASSAAKELNGLIEYVRSRAAERRPPPDPDGGLTDN